MLFAFCECADWLTIWLCRFIETTAPRSSEGGKARPKEGNRDINADGLLGYSSPPPRPVPLSPCPHPASLSDYIPELPEAW